MQPSNARAIHKQAEIARENEDFQKALQLTDQAMITYQEDGDSLGFAEVLSSRFLIFRHLYEQTDDQNYLIDFLSIAVIMKKAKKGNK